MPIPEIKIQFAASGIDNVKNALKTVDRAIEDSYIKRQKLARELAETELKLEHENTNKIINEHRKRTEAIEANDRRNQRLMQDRHDKELKALQQHHNMLAREATQRTHFMGSAFSQLGMNNAGAGMNTAASLGMGAGPGAIIGVAMAAGALIKTAFDTLVSGIKFAAGEFAAAIMEIGGGFSVSKAIVGAAKTERQTAAIYGQALFGGGKPMSMHAIHNIISGASGGTEFSEEEAAGAARAYQAKTGDIAGFGRNASFISKVASVNGTSFEEMSERFGKTKNQFNDFSDEDIRKLFLKEMAIGAHGSVEFKDMANAGRLTKTARLMKGSATDNMGRLLGLTQILTGTTGNVDESFTQVDAFTTSIMRNAGKHQGIFKKYGGKFENGQLTDFDKILENFVVGYKKNPAQVMKDLGGRVEGISTVQEIAGKVTGNTDEERRSSFKQLMDDASGASATLETLDNAFKETSQTTEYSLKSSFIKMATEVGNSLLPEINDFAKILKDNAYMIGQTITLFMKTAESIITGLAPVIFTTLRAMLRATPGNHDKEIRDLTDTENFLKLSPEGRKDYVARKKAEDIANMTPSDSQEARSKIEKTLDKYKTTEGGEIDISKMTEQDKEDYLIAQYLAKSDKYGKELYTNKNQNHDNGGERIGANTYLGLNNNISNTDGSTGQVNADGTAVTENTNITKENTKALQENTKALLNLPISGDSPIIPNRTGSHAVGQE